MQSFNTTRFIQTLKWQLADHKKNFYAPMSKGFLATITPCIFYLAIYKRPLDESTIFNILAIFLAIYLTTCGALIVSNISDKNRRINDFLVPASKLEKFTSRYISLLFSTPVSVTIGVAAAYLLQIPICGIITGSLPTIDLTSIGQNFTWNTTLNTTEGIFLVLSIHSLSLLLGTIFRRNAWIKSCLTVVVASTTLSIITFFGTKSILDAIYGENNYNIVLIESWWVSALQYTLSIIQISLCYRGAFRIYSRMQAVNNKWHNL